MTDMSKTRPTGYRPGKYGPVPNNLRSRAGVRWVYRVLKDWQDEQAGLAALSEKGRE